MALTPQPYGYWYARGEHAFHDGANAFPTGDTEVFNAIAHLPVGGGAADIMRAWTEGWHTANAAAPVPGVPTPS